MAKSKTGAPKPTPERRHTRRQSVFIHDVAKAAGCSISTVSKAINGTGSISIKTRKRVLRAAEDLGYRPNPAAKMLRGQKSENIGLFFYPSCIDLFTSPFYGAVAAGAERVLSVRNYNLLLAGTQLLGDSRVLPKFIVEHSVDGLLLLGRMPDELVDLLMESGLPFVMLDTAAKSPLIDCVVTDNFNGAALATEHLVEKGHQRIAMFAAMDDDSSTQARFNAYRSVMMEHGLFDPGLVLRQSHSEEGGMAAASGLIRRGMPCTAVFCVNDSMAIGAMKTFKSSGIRIPEDVSIVGFDDLYVSRFFHPALTTIRVDQFQMGELGASILLDMLENESHTPCRRIIATRLEERESVRAILPGENGRKRRA